MENMMQPEKKTEHEKLFPRAYIMLNEITVQPLKKSHLMSWLTLFLLALCFGLFAWFQTHLMDEASRLSDIIR
ncbi:MAG: hypothetical protein HQK75_13665 [Candidatus Magnetomorum sp.]|nr:hypothetical protein [Candidatus Magnetomorum sp.]